jgi:phage-related protein/cell wall-associated NlpC family hydrolase
VAGSYHAGTALLDVLPSLKNFHSKIRSELKSVNPTMPVAVTPNMKGFQQKLRAGVGKAPTVQVKIEANKAALAKAEAAVTASEKRMQAARDASKDAVARVDIAEKQLSETRAKSSAKASQIAAAELKLAQAKRASAAASNDARSADAALAGARASVRDAQIKLRTDVDTTGMAAKLQAFASRAGRQYAINLGVDADTTAARASLEAFALTAKRAASVTGNVDIDTGVALTKLAVLSGAGAAVGFAIGGGIGVAGAAIAGIPTLVAAALGPIAALTAGLQGVGDALTAFSDFQDQAATSATANAKAQTSAARQIASAQQQLQQAIVARGRAQQDAEWAAAASTRQVEDAERSLIRAQQQRLKAQQDLTAAVEAARRAQQDLAFQVEGGVLAEQQAVLDLSDAQRQLATARDQGVDGEALERLTLAYQEQELSLRQIRAQNKNLTADKAASDQAGIQGSAQVVAAQDQVAASNEQVAAAARDVQDAQTAAAQQQIQSQRAISDAQQSVLQAQLQLNQAYQDSGTVGSAAADKVSAAMAKLTPEAQAFVLAVQALKPAFAEVTGQVQSALFAGMGPAFTQFANAVLPSVAMNLSAVAGAINQVTQRLFVFLASGPVLAQMQALFAAIAAAIIQAQPAIQVFIQLFLQLAAAAIPAISQLVTALATVAAAIMAALQPLIDSGAFAAAFGQIAQLITALGPPIGIVLSFAIQLMNALGPSLVAVVTSLTPVLQVLSDTLLMMAPFVGMIAQMLASALLPVFQALQPVIAALLPVLTQLIGSALAIAVPIIQQLATVAQALVPVLSMVGGMFVQIWGAVMPLIQALAGGLVGVLTALTPVFNQIMQAVVPLVAQLAQQLAPILGQVAMVIAQVLTTALTTLTPFLSTLVQIIAQVITTVAPFIPIVLQVAGALLNALLPVLPTVADLLLTLLDAVLPILPPLLTLATTIIPLITDVISTLMPIITTLAQILVGVLAVSLQTVVVPILTLLINIVTAVIDVIKLLWDAAVKPVFDAISSAIQWAWQKVIQPTFASIGEATERVSDFFTRMGDKIGGIWDGIKKIVHGGIQGIVDIVYNNGIRALANAVIKYIPGVDYLPELKVPDFATGGRVSGPGSGRSDDIPAMLSNGEFVVTALATSKYLPLLEAMNANRFADGGLAAAVPASAPAAAAGAIAASLVVDPAVFAALGKAAAEVRDTLEALAASITAVENPALAAMGAATVMLAATTVTQVDVMAGRWTLFQQQHAAVWAALTASVAASTASQGSYFATLANGMANLRTAMTLTADWATSQYARMRGAAADPVRWVLANPFNAGLIAAWNRLNGDFNLGKAIAPVAIPFAVGGRVSGAGTGTSDSIPALLSNGEFVVREAIARQAMPFLQALNAGQAEALQATGARRYASGGIVADTGSQLNAAVTRASVFAMQQDGKPYVWGGVGPGGFDCSGLMSAITNTLRGESNPYRRVGTAASAPWPGFVTGLSTGFAMGSSSGHTAGTLGGVNVEATGTHVRYGKDAHGADDRQFPTRSSLPLAGGTFVPGGGGALDLSQIIGSAFADTYRMIGQIATLYAANMMADQAGGVATAATDAVKGAALSKISALAAVSSVAGSPEVVAAVRAVAATFGWGSGPEWDALSSLISGESSWNPAIKNPSTSATGLFQKMTSIHGPIEPTVGGQAQWGLNYIRSRYGDPISAYRAWLSRSPHWYHVGGIAPGSGDVPAVLQGGERVLTVQQTRAFDRLVASIGANGVERATTTTEQRSGDTYNIYPRENQDEAAIGAEVSRRQAFKARIA